MDMRSQQTLDIYHCVVLHGLQCVLQVLHLLKNSYKTDIHSNNRNTPAGKVLISINTSKDLIIHFIKEPLITKSTWLDFDFR